MAYQFWANQGQRDKKTFLCLENAYHGDTLGAVSVGGIPLFHQVYQPLLFKTIQAPSPYCYRCPLRKKPDTCRNQCLDRLEQVMARRHRSIAAFILEPLVQGAAGMITFPDGYLKRARELCDRYKILMIADEVAVGFGRTGTLFACAQEKVSPDLLCLGKGITGGYLPLAATLTTEAVYQAFLGPVEALKTFYHGHTYTGNPLACAVALENLRLMQERDFFPELRKKISYLKIPPASHLTGWNMWGRYDRGGSWSESNWFRTKNPKPPTRWKPEWVIGLFWRPGIRGSSSAPWETSSCSCLPWVFL